MIAWLGARTPFPSVMRALQEPNGLLAAGGDLSPWRLVEAYRHGIFPWYSEGQPILWWSTDPRMVLFVDEFRVSRSLRKRVQSGIFDVRIDSAFRDVIEACAHTPRDGQAGTWITRDMIEAYVEMHRRGYGHSVECWRNGRLVGGLYGLAIGRVFFGESMFSHETDASKVAMVGLVAHLQQIGVALIDCQQETGHLASLGARPIPRQRFAALLVELIHSSDPPAGWPLSDTVEGMTTSSTA